jgi:hypothetical protein
MQFEKSIFSYNILIEITLSGSNNYCNEIIHRPICYCATSWKVAGSIPDVVIGIFHWHNPSCRNMALGSTQLLTEMRTRNISSSVKAAAA